MPELRMCEGGKEPSDIGCAKVSSPRLAVRVGLASSPSEIQSEVPSVGEVSSAGLCLPSAGKASAMLHPLDAPPPSVSVPPVGSPLAPPVRSGESSPLQVGNAYHLSVPPENLVSPPKRSVPASQPAQQRPARPRSLRRIWSTPRKLSSTVRASSQTPERRPLGAAYVGLGGAGADKEGGPAQTSSLASSAEAPPREFDNVAPVLKANSPNRRPRPVRRAFRERKAGYCEGEATLTTYANRNLEPQPVPKRNAQSAPLPLGVAPFVPAQREKKNRASSPPNPQSRPSEQEKRVANGTARTSVVATTPGRNQELGGNSSASPSDSVSQRHAGSAPGANEAQGVDMGMAESQRGVLSPERIGGAQNLLESSAGPANGFHGSPSGEVPDVVMTEAEAKQLLAETVTKWKENVLRSKTEHVEEAMRCKLPGYGAVRPPPLPRTSRRLNSRKNREEPQRKKQKRVKKDSSLVYDEPVLQGFHHCDIERKLSIFSRAKYNGVVYNVGDHVALHKDGDGEEWIVVCEGFYAGVDNAPMFYGRWYFSPGDVEAAGTPLPRIGRQRKVAAYERFSTDARDMNPVESIEKKVHVLSLDQFEGLHKLDPSLIDAKGMYYCHRFYSTEDLEFGNLSKDAFPGDQLPARVVSKKAELLKSRFAAKNPVVPVRTSKRKRNSRLLSSVGSAGFSIDDAFDGAHVDDTGLEEAARRLRPRTSL